MTHTSLPGYECPTTDDFILIEKFYDDWKSVNAINYLLKLTEHLTINSHYGPWFPREGSLITKDSFKKYARYGFYPVNYMREISVKTKYYLIRFKEQQLKIFFYESTSIKLLLGLVIIHKN